MRSFRFEEAQPKDIDVIFQLVKELADHEGRPDAVTATPNDLAALLFGDAAIAKSFVGYGNDKPVAYALVCKMFSSFRAKPILYIEDVLVTKTVQGSGYGRFMMAHLADYALKTGCCAMEWSALTTNGEAEAFYQRLGAEKEHGRLHFDMGLDSLELLAEQRGG